MSAATLIADLEQAGVTLGVNGDRLGWRAPEGVMTGARVDALRRYKPDVMAAIEARPVCAASAEWGAVAVAVEWFLDSEPPREPFVMVWNDRRTRPAITIIDPRGFWRDLRIDITAGAGLGRDHVGAVRNDLRRLYQLFGPHGK